MDELQQMLLKDDCYLPGIINHDKDDLALRAKVRTDAGSSPEAVVNGVTARIGYVCLAKAWRRSFISWIDYGLNWHDIRMRRSNSKTHAKGRKHTTPENGSIKTDLHHPLDTGDAGLVVFE